MGLKAMIVLFMGFTFSLLVLNPSLSILPYWLTSNEDLYILLIVIWVFVFILGFIKYGLEK